jgi:Ca2+-binding EF-hand superfamily protein
MGDLSKYYERNDLEKAVRMQVASQLSATKLPQLNAAFKKFDANCNGMLSMDELACALEELGVDSATALRAAEALDVDRSGEEGNREKASVLKLK